MHHPKDLKLPISFHPTHWVTHPIHHITHDSCLHIFQAQAVHHRALSVHLVSSSTLCIAASQLQVFLPLLLPILFQNAELNFSICFVSWIGAAKSSPVGVEPTFLRSFLPQACTLKLLRHDWILFDVVACLHQFLCLEWNLVATSRVHCSIRFSFSFQVIIVVLSFEVCEVCLIKA